MGWMQNDAKQTGEYDPKDHVDITPQQYHAGLDKLWKALKLTGPQDKDVFTLCVERIAELEKQCS